jgi:uncharacterized protein YndB with AHSA1/START domain
MFPQFEKTIRINSEPATVWNTLTDLELMKQWMGTAEMEIEIKTDWKMNSPIIISGRHHIGFENKGTVLKYERNQKLKYSHLSSLSRLEDRPDNYSTIEFELIPLKGQTALTLTIEHFPTETIYKHLCFYWRTTIEKIRLLAEKQVEPLTHNPGTLN